MNIRDKFDPSTHVLDKYDWEWMNNVAKDIIGGYHEVLDNGSTIRLTGTGMPPSQLIPKPQEPINLPTEIDMEFQYIQFFVLCSCLGVIRPVGEGDPGGKRDVCVFP